MELKVNEIKYVDSDGDAVLDRIQWYAYKKAETSAGNIISFFAEGEYEFYPLKVPNEGEEKIQYKVSDLDDAKVLALLKEKLGDEGVSAIESKIDANIALNQNQNIGRGLPWKESE